MDKKLLSIYLIFIGILYFSTSATAQNESIVNVGLIIKDKSSKADLSVKNWLFENLRKTNKTNGIYKYIFIDDAINKKNIETFQYVMELETGSAIQNVSAYSYVTKTEKKVPVKKSTTKTTSKDKTTTKKTEEKTSKTKTTTKKTEEKQEYKTVKVDVPHSGVKLESSARFIGRIYDIKNGKYLNGFIVDYKTLKDFPDIGMYNEIKAISKKKKTNETESSIKQKYLDKYKNSINSKKTSFKKEFISYSFDKILYNTSYCFNYPLEIIDVTKKTKKKAKNVKLSGNRLLQDQKVDVICAEVKDEKGHVKFERVAQMIMKGDLYDKNEAKVRFSQKKVLKAFNENRRMVIGKYKEHERFLNDTAQKKYTVIPIFNINNSQTRKASAYLTYKFNHYLNDIPIFEVLDRGTIQDIEKTQELLKTDGALDSKNSFQLRDQLKGADYIVLIDIKPGVNSVAKLIETKTGSLLNTTKIDLPIGNSGEVNFYNLVVPAFKLNTEIVDIKKGSSNKANEVYIKSMFPLKDDSKYIVYKIENRMVNGKNLERTVEVGEIEIDDLYSRTFAVADVKNGKKEILKHFKNGDRLVCLPKKKKEKGLFGQLFDFNFENYENIHIVNDKPSNSTMVMH